MKTSQNLIIKYIFRVKSGLAVIELKMHRKYYEIRWYRESFRPYVYSIFLIKGGILWK